MSNLKVFSIGLSAAGGAMAAVAAALSAAADKFIVTVTNHMPRHISLPEIGLFLQDVNAADGSNKGTATVTSKDALLRCLSSIEAIAQLNGFDGDCMTVEFEIDADALPEEVIPDPVVPLTESTNQPPESPVLDVADAGANKPADEGGGTDAEKPAGDASGVGEDAPKGDAPGTGNDDEAAASTAAPATTGRKAKK